MRLKFEVLLSEYRHHTRDQVFVLSNLRRDMVFYKGDTNTLRLKIRHEDHSHCITDVNITGWSFYLIGKNNPTDSDSDAIVYRYVGILNDSGDGEVDISLTEVSGEDFSGNLCYQLRSIDNHEKILILGEGLLQFKQSLFDES